MRITLSELKQIIRQEVRNARLLKEASQPSVDEKNKTHFIFSLSNGEKVSLKKDIFKKNMNVKDLMGSVKTWGNAKNEEELKTKLSSAKALKESRFFDSRSGRLLREMEGMEMPLNQTIELENDEQMALTVLRNNMIKTDLWSDLNAVLSALYPDVTSRVGQYEELSKRGTASEWFDEKRNDLQNTINKAFKVNRELAMELMRLLNAAAFKRTGDTPFRQPYGY